MKLSLIITTYNNPAALKKVAESVKGQTRLPDEVMIADDGSDEPTAAVVKLFSATAPFPVHHVRQEHKGFRAARIRNEAIKKTTGDYIVLLDGDCIANRHFLADHLSLAEEGCFFQGKRVHIKKNAVDFFSYEYANSFPVLAKMALQGKISNIHHLLRLPLYLSIKNKKLKGIKSCNMGFFRKDIFAVNGFNEDFVGWGNEDSELACRFFHYGLRKKVHMFLAICFHLWHTSNRSFTEGNKHLLKITLRSGEYFCKNGISKTISLSERDNASYGRE